MNSYDHLSPPVLQVSQLNRLLRELMENEQLLKDIWIAGEISNFTRATSGHLYFTLKDHAASLKCVIWKGNTFRLRMNLRDGMSVEAHGAVTIYEARGECQLVVDTFRLAGEGALFQEFLRRKALLEVEGLFDLDHKRPLPGVPQRIGVVTSSTGAALQDILDTLRRRYPLAEVIVSPASVQGDRAPEEIVSALKILYDRNQPDVIILARGGGSLEDLWAFNDEVVVRMLAASPVPVVTGIGHETDFTLCDFAADRRAPTPTAAAELASPDIADFHIRLGELVESLSLAMDQLLDEKQETIKTGSDHLARLSPRSQIENNSRRLDELTSRSQVIFRHSSEIRSAQILNLTHHLFALDPHRVLQRGYALVRSEDGTTIKSINQVSMTQQINVQVSDGCFGAQVNNPPLPQGAKQD